MRYFSATKKEQNNAICSNMIKLEIIILSEVSQKEKDKYHVTYMWNLKYGTSEPIWTETEIRFAVARG